MDTLLHDLRYGLRMLTKHPGFTTVAVLVLALGIGANSAIFSIVNAVLLQPLPYEEPERVMMLWGDNRKEATTTDPVSYPNFLDWKAQSRSFEEMAAVTPRWTFNLTGIRNPNRISGLFVTANLFPMLGVTPAQGRLFTPEEEQADSAPAVIISHGLWQRSFGGDPEIIGKPIMIDSIAFTVVGLMPTGFSFMEDVDLWAPLSPVHPSMARFINRRSVRLYLPVGRLKSGVSQAQAQTEMTTIASQLAQEYPDTNDGMGVSLLPLHDQITGSIRSSLLLLFGAVGFVLLIACANVANLILTRTAVRRKEVAIRVALGAGRMRIIRQLLTESVLLSVLGGAGGVLQAIWGVDALPAFSPASLPRQGAIGLDSQVFSFTLIISIITGVLFGLAPALQASRHDQYDTLKEGGRNISSGSTSFRNGLVVFEIATALVLLVSSGLLVRSFMLVLDENPGFRSDNILTLSALLPRSTYNDSPQRITFWNELEARISGLPGVSSVGATTRIPMRGPNNNVTTTLTIEEQPLPEGQKPEIDFRRASPDYFSTMGIPLLQGRAFTDRDMSTEQQTVIVNQAMAQRFFPGENSIEKRIKLGSNSDDDPWMTIVGVVGDIRHTALDIAPRPEVYRHLMTNPPFGPVWAIHTAVDPITLINPIRAQIREMDPDLPVSGIVTMEEMLGRSIAQRRFAMQLLGLFAGVALLLAAIGIYGVMSYAVTQQTREIGIRMALGARPGDILRQVVGRGMLLAAIGGVPGIAAAVGITRLLSNMLYGVAPTDPVTYLGIAVLLVLVTLIANYLPARRAMRVDPMVALRYD